MRVCACVRQTCAQFRVSACEREREGHKVRHKRCAPPHRKCVRPLMGFPKEKKKVRVRFSFFKVNPSKWPNTNIQNHRLIQAHKYTPHTHTPHTKTHTPQCIQWVASTPERWCTPFPKRECLDDRDTFSGIWFRKEPCSAPNLSPRRFSWSPFPNQEKDILDRNSKGKFSKIQGAHQKNTQSILPCVRFIYTCVYVCVCGVCVWGVYLCACVCECMLTVTCSKSACAHTNTRPLIPSAISAFNFKP